MNRKSVLHLLVFFLVFSFAFNLFAQNSEDSKKIPFKEIWGYVMIGEESSLKASYPCTDIGYFVNAVNTFSEFVPVPKRAEKFPDYKGRIHLVTSVDSKAQTHLLLDPKLPLRNKIIKELLEQTEEYDGLQIDWESVPKEDDEHFWEFLKILKKKLKGKPLSVAIPARTKTLEKDAYDYAKLSKIVDKIIVMAYDEHWSTSAPGPIASFSWCKRIADYAKTVIPEEKLVMGCHFYSRSWSQPRWSSQAFRMYKIDDIVKSNKVSSFTKSATGDLSFSYEEKRTIKVFYDTIESSAARCKMYRDNEIARLSFWRIGQEIPEFWDKIEIVD